MRYLNKYKKGSSISSSSIIKLQIHWKQKRDKTNVTSTTSSMKIQFNGNKIYKSMGAINVSSVSTSSSTMKSLEHVMEREREMYMDKVLKR